jgi:hypothetical protein
MSSSAHFTTGWRLSQLIHDGNSLTFSTSSRLSTQWISQALTLGVRSQSQSQSQSYFTTGGLQPMISSWRQVSWGSRPEYFFQLNPCRHSPLWPKYGLVSYEYAWPSSSVRMAHIVCCWKFFHLLSIQVLCQSRHCIADHAYLTYLMLERQLSHLNGRKLDHLQV